jgi:membrane-associated protease RseP (regulator of RpoE activity)
MRRVRMQLLPSGRRGDHGGRAAPMQIEQVMQVMQVTLAACVVLGAIAARSWAQQEAAPPAGATFQPGEISIGEPVTLPFGAPPAVPAGSPSGGAAAPRTGGESAATAAPRSGWLGMVVAESNVPGRWRVDEVATGGPADVAGIRVGDELRAVNGVAPRNADEVSQALTAIVADQPVRVAIARGDEVSDVILRATPRPTAGPRGSAAPGADVPTPPAAPTASADPIATGMAASPPPPFAAPPPAALSPPPAALSPPPAASSLPPTSSEPALPPLPDVSVPMAAAPPAVFEPAPTMAPRFRSESEPATAPATSFVPAAPSWSGVGAVPAVPQAERPGAATLGAAALGSETVTSAATAPGRRTALGVRTIPIDPLTQARFQLTEPVGAYVIGVVQDLPASRAGVPPGSVIVAIDERPVHSPMELTSLVTSSPVDRPITVRFVLPGGTSRDAAVMLQSIDPPLLQALGAEATASPGPASGGRVARRPVDDTVTTLRREIGILRRSLEQLERRLDGLVTDRR